jgi:uncharacterized protein YidB (DUF937 family)
VQGLVDRFHEQGLGSVVSSWIGTGQNLPISADQIKSVLGNEQVQAIAQKAGISTDSVAANLATLLPQVIDKLTPNGEVPEGSTLQKGLALFKGLANLSGGAGAAAVPPAEGQQPRS